MRVACLLVPDLPLRAELRARPERVGAPVAIASGTDPRAELLGVSPEAHALGVRPGHTVTHARAIHPALQVAAASPALDLAARETLRDVALSFSPRVALAPRGEGPFASEAAVFLDAGGVASLFHSEQGFASAVGRRAETLGIPGAVALASSRNVALLVARELARAGLTTGDSRVRVLAPGGEAAFLAPLPLDLLAPAEPLAHALGRFGVRTVRDLLRLPREALVQRLGAEVVALIERARGREHEGPLREHRETRVTEALDFESPIDRSEPLQFALRGLLPRLTQRLAVRALACGELELELELCGGGRDARRVGVAGPTNDVRVLARLVILALETHPPSAPLLALTLSTVGKSLRSDQLDLFRPPGPSPAALDRTLCELEALCGADRVGSPRTADDHRPGAFTMAPFHASPPERVASNTPEAGTPQIELAVRALRPPVRARVRIERGRPAEIESAVARGRVVGAAGPWRTTGHWWSDEERFAFEHFDVQISDGTVARLCFDWLRRVWHVDAIYD